jgi:hypothetical protein
MPLICILRAIFGLGEQLSSAVGASLFHSVESVLEIFFAVGVLAGNSQYAERTGVGVTNFALHTLSIL